MFFISVVLCLLLVGLNGSTTQLLACRVLQQQLLYVLAKKSIMFIAVMITDNANRKQWFGGAFFYPIPLLRHLLDTTTLSTGCSALLCWLTDRLFVSSMDMGANTQFLHTGCVHHHRITLRLQSTTRRLDCETRVKVKPLPSVSGPVSRASAMHARLIAIIII